MEEQIRHREYSRNILLCAFHTLVITWIFAFIVGITIRNVDDSVSEFIYGNHWVPVFYIGSAVIWVVFSRVVGNRVRSMFFLWYLFSIVCLVAWGSSHPKYGLGVIIASGFMACLFTVLYTHTKYTKLRQSFMKNVATDLFYIGASVGIILGVLAVIGTQVTDLGNLVSNPLYFGFIIAFPVFLATFQMVNTRYYIFTNQHLDTNPDTCMFAVMSPWTETVDTFAVLSRYH